MFLKSTLDFIISLLALMVLALPMVILALIIKLDDRGPVFFKQKRIGKDQKHFMMLKFRTMRTDTPKDTATHLLTDPQKYITKVGRFLRKTSLDELPQLLNILCGHMSIVGPRPALWNQFDLIEEREKYGVHQVRPGLTGWAQVNGRDELEIPVKAKLDGEYIEKFGLMMDIRCFFATFGILDGKGVVEGGTGELHRQEQEKK
ncbi:MAG: sugar transferase [Oscillospiraceae bacterium]|nr:sugar transferase [Oscillospiraceae bacterium]